MDIVKKVNEILQKDIVNCQRIAKESSSQLFLCDEMYFAKFMDNSWKCANEAYMLAYLKEYTNLPIPTYLGHAKKILVTRYIKEDYTMTNDAIEHQAAMYLSTLHRISSKEYGFDRDTALELIPQSNKKDISWISFFTNERILSFSNAAYMEGKIDEKLLARIERLCKDLHKFLDEPEHPSLLHGNIWSNHILVRDDKIAAFLDPALYYGHHEMELAALKLANTFSENFFRHYETFFPLKEGFYEERIFIYQLYPLLASTRFFGKKYVPYLERSLSKLGY